MPFQISGRTLLAYEEVTPNNPNPLPTISAQLIAGWVCPECGSVLRTLSGPWNDPDAAWWEYDPLKNQSSGADYWSSTKLVSRPQAPKAMPNYRGMFNKQGGYLRSFDHAQPLSGASSSRQCSLGISLRLGAMGFAASLPKVQPKVIETISQTLSSGGEFRHIREIPDVLGRHESIYATTSDMAYAWRSVSSYVYEEEKKVKMWTEFLPKLLELKS